MADSTQPFQTPPNPVDTESDQRDPHIQSGLDIEVFRFLGLTGTSLAPLAWIFGAFGLGNLWLGTFFGLLILWMLYLEVIRAIVLTRDQDRSVQAGVGEGTVDSTGRNWRWFGARGTHLGMVVIDGISYGLALKAVKRLRPGARVRVVYYESSRHIIRIEEIAPK